MDTKKIKKFAVNLRNELIDEIKNKIQYIISLKNEEYPAYYRNHLEKIKRLKEEVEKYGLEETTEKVAYIWANRLIAHRYMDLKNINTPMVVTPRQGETVPEIFSLAKEGNFPDDIKLDKEEFFKILDGEIKSNNPQNEAYSMLFIAVCNKYFELMPFLFEKEGDFTELLLPNDLLSQNSIRAKIVENITDEEAKDVEILGWIYQFYISEKKDKVYQQLKKNVKISDKNIPAATQLFTPHWIVRYLVENSLGRLWILNKPNSRLKEFMKYYVESDADDNFIKISSPEEITFLDPCCGSGHMLTYAFDLLTKIYEEEGYPRSEIPKLILQKNLYGCDVDKRAVNIAGFALMMKAKEYYKRFFRKKQLPNIVELEEYDVDEFKGIKNFGSLIRIEEPENIKIKNPFFFSEVDKKNFELQKKILSSQFHCVVTNPPYMGSKGMNEELKKFVAKNFPDAKSDLFACFIERCLDFTKFKGYTAMITMQSWMFLSSFEKLRIKILKNHKINSLVHLGARAFDEIGGEVVQTTAFVIQKFTD